MVPEVEAGLRGEAWRAADLVAGSLAPVWSCCSGGGNPGYGHQRDSIMGLKAGQSNLQGSFDSRNSKRSGQRAVVMTSGTNRHSPEGRARVKMLVNRMKWKGKHWEEWEQLGGCRCTRGLGR